MWPPDEAIARARLLLVKTQHAVLMLDERLDLGDDYARLVVLRGGSVALHRRCGRCRRFVARGWCIEVVLAPLRPADHAFACPGCLDELVASHAPYPGLTPTLEAWWLAPIVLPGDELHVALEVAFWQLAGGSR